MHAFLHDTIGVLCLTTLYFFIFFLQDVTVRSYRGEKYLSCSHSFVVDEADDYGEAVDASAVHGSTTQSVFTGDIISVLSVERHPCCIACKCKVEEISDGVGRCKKCLASVKMSGCSGGSAAGLVINCGTEKYTVVAFNEIVNSLIDRSQVRDEPCPDVENILFTPKMKFTVRDDVVKSI